jgi:hypothetical protein
MSTSGRLSHKACLRGTQTGLEIFPAAGYAGAKLLRSSWVPNVPEVLIVPDVWNGLNNWNDWNMNN